MVKLPGTTVHHLVAERIRKEAGRRNASITGMIRTILTDWAIERECEDRCKLIEGVVWDDCMKICREMLKKGLGG